MKKIKTVWKRSLLWIGAAAMLLLCACQSKNGDTAAIQTWKQADALLNLASERTGVPLDIPDRLTVSAQSADGSVVLKADANIVILGDGVYPVSRVEGVDFSQETVDRFIETVLPGVTLHNVRTERIQEDVQDHIDRHKAKRDRYEQMGMLERYEKKLAELERELKTVPESVPEVPYDGKLHTMAHDYGAFTTNYQGLYIGELTKDLGIGRYLRVASNDDMTEPFNNGTDSAAVTKGAELSYFDNRDGQALDTVYNEIRDVTGETTVDAAAQGQLAMTPLEAQNTVNALLQQLGVDAIAMQTILLGEGEMDDSHQFITPPTRFVYRIACARVLGGAPNILCNATAYAKDETDTIIGQWGYETIRVEINDQGVVRFDWRSPHVVTQTVVESATLLPFENVQEVLTTMVPVIFSEEVKILHLKQYRADVSHAVLGLMRILDSDGLNSGLLIPVWAFYGNQRYINEDGSVENYDYSDIPIIVINAIDGTVIDRAQGY